ncbi:MAG: hypothetical protein AAF727_13260, partial [Pseudomonadota bacterium]
EVYRETTRRMLELQHRPDTITAMQSGAARLATRGDTVMASIDILDRTVAAARVKDVEGRAVALDEVIEVKAGYGLRFKVYSDPEDLVGTSIVAPFLDVEGSTSVVTLKSGYSLPSPGDLVHIGPVASESMALKVRGVEGAQDFSSRLIMLPAAPQIDDIIDALEPPAWDGIVGTIATFPASLLQVPLFASVRASQPLGVGSSSAPYTLDISLRPDPASIDVTGFELDHRTGGTTDWTTLTFPAASAGTSLEGLERDDVIELRARAVSGDTVSPSTPTVTIVVGVDDPDIPAALEAEGISVLGALGHAIIGVSVPQDSSATVLQIYRAPSGVALDRSAHAVGAPIAVTDGSTLTYVDGDATRTNILTGGGFASDDGWAEGDGWLIEAGVANHAPGLAGDLSKALALSAGTTYRVAFDVTQRAAGGVTAKLIGGTEVIGITATQTGDAFDRLTALSGNTDIALAATSDFDGDVDDLVVFIETANCVDAGRWDYYVEPQNEQNIAGPVAGPFPATIF